MTAQEAREYLTANETAPVEMPEFFGIVDSAIESLGDAANQSVILDDRSPLSRWLAALRDNTRWQAKLLANKSWDAGEHPRDSKGRFTWAYGAKYGGIELERKGDKPLYSKSTGKPIKDGSGRHRKGGGKWVRKDRKPLSKKHEDNARAIPPTWRNVVLNPDAAHPHRAVGEYLSSGGNWVRSSKYDPVWLDKNNAKKFSRMRDAKSMSEKIEKITQKAVRDMKSGSEVDRDTAAAAAVMAATGARPDTGGAVSKFATYGATSLEGRHIRFSEGSGKTILHYVPGKNKGEPIHIEVHNKDLAKELLRRKRVYGNNKPIFPAATYASVNRYSHERLGVKPKDMRTMRATETLLSEIRSAHPPKEIAKWKEFRKSLLQSAAAKIHSETWASTAVRKYFHPSAIKMLDSLQP